MQKLISLTFLLVAFLFVSCRVERTIPVHQTYFWEGKQVSKKKYDELLHKHTVQFVENYIKNQK